jgi:quinol monooxygenase YgiN
MAIGTLAILRIQEGKNEEFENIFCELEAAVRANEPGNNFYSCHRTDDPTVYIVMEQYADQAAVDAHRASDHFREIGGKLGGVMAGRPEIQSPLESIS